MPQEHPTGRETPTPQPPTAGSPCPRVRPVLPGGFQQRPWRPCALLGRFPCPPPACSGSCRCEAAGGRLAFNTSPGTCASCPSDCSGSRVGERLQRTVSLKGHSLLSREEGRQVCSPCAAPPRQPPGCSFPMGTVSRSKSWFCHDTAPVEFAVSCRHVGLTLEPPGRAQPPGTRPPSWVCEPNASCGQGGVGLLAGVFGGRLH